MNSNVDQAFGRIIVNIDHIILSYYYRCLFIARQICNCIIKKKNYPEDWNLRLHTYSYNMSIIYYMYLYELHNF